MNDTDTPEPDVPKAATKRTAASFTEKPTKNAAARAAAASTKLENRDLPNDYVRSDGVKRLLAKRDARKR